MTSGSEYTWKPLVVSGTPELSVHYLINESGTRLACWRGKGGRRLKRPRPMKVWPCAKRGPLARLTLGGFHYMVPLSHLAQGLPLVKEDHLVGRTLVYKTGQFSPDLDQVRRSGFN